MGLARTARIALVSTALAAGLVASGVLPAAASGSRGTPDPSASTLRALARHTGLRVGTAVNMDALADDPIYRAAVADQFDTVTPENVMKWEVVEPGRGPI